MEARIARIAQQHLLVILRTPALIARHVRLDHFSQPDTHGVWQRLRRGYRVFPPPPRLGCAEKSLGISVLIDENTRTHSRGSKGDSISWWVLSTQAPARILNESRTLGNSSCRESIRPGNAGWGNWRDSRLEIQCFLVNSPDPLD
eukprot:COSAG02_NODE_5603_length_4194_cov_14.130159_2_plen_145_part_00